jgi:hypothetical protein
MLVEAICGELNDISLETAVLLSDTERKITAQIIQKHMSRLFILI